MTAPTWRSRESRCSAEVPAKLWWRRTTRPSTNPASRQSATSSSEVEPAARTQHAERLAQHLRLVGREVEHAVRQDDVDRRAGDRQLLEHPAADLDERVQARLARGVGGGLAHRGREIDADRAPVWTDAACRQQEIHAGAARVIEHDLAGADRPGGDRVADPGEARGRARGQRPELVGVVAQRLRGVAGAAVEVEVALGLAGDTIVGLEDAVAELRDIEADGAVSGHARSLEQQWCRASFPWISATCSLS